MSKGNKAVEETVEESVESTSENIDQSVEDSTEITSETIETSEIKEPEKPLTRSEQARRQLEILRQQMEEQLKLISAQEEDPLITSFYDRIDMIKVKRAELQAMFSEVETKAEELKVKYANDPVVLEDILRNLIDATPAQSRVKQRNEANYEKVVATSDVMPKKRVTLPKAGQKQTKATLRFFELRDQDVPQIKAVVMVADELIATEEDYATMKKEKGYAHTVIHVARLINLFKEAGLLNVKFNTSKGELVAFYAERLPEYYEWLKTIEG